MLNTVRLRHCPGYLAVGRHWETSGRRELITILLSWLYHCRSVVQWITLLIMLACWVIFYSCTTNCWYWRILLLCTSVYSGPSLLSNYHYRILYQTQDFLSVCPSMPFVWLEALVCIISEFKIIGRKKYHSQNRAQFFGYIYFW